MTKRRLHRIFGTVCVVFSASLLMPAKSAVSQGQDNASQRTVKDAQKTPTKPAQLVYRPPRRGAPLARVGAGTRGQDDAGPVLYVLTPDHIGLTTQVQPALYWYVSQAVVTRFEFSLINDKTLETVLETELNDVDGAGIQKISLKKLAVELEPGVAYQWFVALVGDSGQRSRDIVASGLIERVEPSRDLSTRLDSMQDEQRAVLYAEEGLWYDALATLSTLIESRPVDRQLRGLRAALLEQGGLQNVAGVDRLAAGTSR